MNENLVEAVDELNIWAVENVESLPIEEAAAVLLQVRQVEENLGIIDALLERWIYAIFKDQGWRTGHDHPRTVDGVGEVRASKRKITKWDTEAAIKAWFEAWLDTWLTDHDGALPEPWEAIQEILRIVGTIKQDGAYGAVALRKIPLAAAGVNTDDYTWDEFGAPKVTIEPVKDGDDDD
jgi:hypothetical protein